MDDLDAHEQSVLDDLSSLFLAALAHKDAGRFDTAEESLRAVIRAEPRLGEPHMELARLLVDTDRLEDAEAHAREALEHLEAGGVWTEDIPEDVVRGLAHALLAEILRRRAEDDDVLFGEPDRFHAMVREAKQHFQRAASYDPADEYSSYHAFFLGPATGKAPKEEG